MELLQAALLTVAGLAAGSLQGWNASGCVGSWGVARQQQVLLTGSNSQSPNLKGPSFQTLRSYQKVSLAYSCLQSPSSQNPCPQSILFESLSMYPFVHLGLSHSMMPPSLGGVSAKGFNNPKQRLYIPRNSSITMHAMAVACKNFATSFDMYIRTFRFFRVPESDFYL